MNRGGKWEDIYVRLFCPAKSINDEGDNIMWTGFFSIIAMIAFGIAIISVILYLVRRDERMFFIGVSFLFIGMTMIAITRYLATGVIPLFYGVVILVNVAVLLSTMFRRKNHRQIREGGRVAMSDRFKNDTQTRNAHRSSWISFWILIILINLDIMYKLSQGYRVDQLYDLFIIILVGINLMIFMRFFPRKK
jgi:hypothetical protein